MAVLNLSTQYGIIHGMKRTMPCGVINKEVVGLDRTPGVSSSQLRAGCAASAPNTPYGYRGG